MVSVHVNPAAPLWTARQFHVLPERSHQHAFLSDLWAAVETETGGRLAVTVHAQSDGQAGAGPDAFDMLVSGELEFYTLNGNAIGRRVPATEIQGLPYAYATSADVHRANDGALGAYLSGECAAQGIHRFQRGLLENGFRQTYMFDRPIRHVDDFGGMRIRSTASAMNKDVLASFGAEPVVINILRIHAALRERQVDGHENPLVIVDVGGFHDITPYASLTQHMWTGFNIIANLAFWNRLPADVQAVVDANVTKFAARQRAYTIGMNDTLAPILEARGMSITRPDLASFKGALQANGFYSRWKSQVGSTAWSLLEAEVGPLG
jgi:TRAP-type C4-dicarboxylate transport system substrate-binding protein